MNPRVATIARNTVGLRNELTKTRPNKENKINPGILQQNFGSQSFELSVM
jgi:hypothetical protein